MKRLMELSLGTMIKIKCRLGFSERNSSVCLMAETVDEIRDVKLVFD
jgi:hypothetical protein